MIGSIREKLAIFLCVGVAMAFVADCLGWTGRSAPTAPSPPPREPVAPAPAVVPRAAPIATAWHACIQGVGARQVIMLGQNRGSAPPPGLHVILQADGAPFATPELWMTGVMTDHVGLRDPAHERHVVANLRFTPDHALVDVELSPVPSETDPLLAPDGVYHRIHAPLSQIADGETCDEPAVTRAAARPAGGSAAAP